MKNKFLLLVLVFAYNILNAQTDFTGIWNGTLNVPGELRLVLHVTKSQNGLYEGTLDSPDQNVSGIKCDKVEVSKVADGNEVLNFTINKIKVSYTGTLVNDTTLSGTFTQGANIPLDLHRAAVAFTAKNIVRPQTPKPPFPYKSEDVIYNGNGLQYGATITIPEGKGPFPAVLLITGSGAQDRDETIFYHKPFAVIADALTKDGFVVLRVDDRGVGKSTGDFATSITADFVNDVNTSFDYLKSRPEVNDKKVGLLGHSEGAMIAPVVASQRKDVDFIVLLAAPGVKIIDLMTEQNAAFLKSLGVPDAAVENFKPVYQQVINAIVSAQDTATARTNALQIVNDWYAKTDSTTTHELGFTSLNDNEQYAKTMAAQVSSPWFKYFIQFDPQPYLSDLKKVKVLALNGSRDIQVVAQQNLPAVNAALKEGRTKNFETKELPGLNHLFQTCNKCTVQEYGQLEETIAPIALQTIEDWLNRNVK
ncbi:MAG TPA: alpha/beta fold hydrolase [Parafilimonas sp.]|nr:alpha/beta fold hydrolase [Parafilimonas sp.]